MVELPQRGRAEDRLALGLAQLRPRRGAVPLQVRHDVAVVQVVAPAHQRAAAARQIERRRDGGGAAHRAVPADLAEELEQQVAAEREADRQHAVAGQLRVEPIEHGGEVGGEAGVIVAATIGAGRPGAAQVDLEHGIAAGEEVRRGDHHVAAALVARDAVDQHDQRPVAALVGQVQRSDQSIAAAVPQRHDDLRAARLGKAWSRLSA